MSSRPTPVAVAQQRRGACIPQQGVDDDQSSFHFANQSAAYGLVPSYEAQLARSSAYQRVEKVAADELLTRKIELLSGKYALEEKIDGLLLDVKLKDKTVARLENAAVLKDEKIARQEKDILSKNEKVAQLKQDNWWMHKKANQLEQDMMLKHEQIDILERDILLEDEDLLSTKKRITQLEGRFKQKVELKGLEDD